MDKKQKMNRNLLSCLKLLTRQNFEFPVSRQMIKYSVENKFPEFRGISDTMIERALREKLGYRYKPLT